MPQRQHRDGEARRPWRQALSGALARLAARLDPPPPAAEDPDPRRAALAAVIGALPLRVIMVDRDIRLLAASKSSAEGMGAPADALIGKTLFEIDEEYFGPYRAITGRCLAGETILAPRVRARKGPGGPEVWLRTEISPWRDESGEISGLISVSVEITDVMEALEASERSEQRLQVAVEIADLHVWELDFVTGEMLTAGASDTFFDGSLDPQQIARDTNITIHPEDRARIATAWREAVEADVPFRPEYRTNRQDGKEVWAACTTKLVRDADGKHLRLIGAMQNVTERKKAEAAIVQAKEEAEAANRAKSIFLATMSHEIRTPLNGVLGMAQAMAADDLTPTQRSRLETIRQSGENLLVILNDVLDLSKIEAGKLELEVVDFELTPLIDGVKAAFDDMAARKGLGFVLDVKDDVRGIYRGDSTRLRQILLNLASNALKFTETGEVRVGVVRQGDQLAFSVRDTGIGIAPDRMARLFNKFEQADASTTRRFGGTGLGLAISRDLAGLMGGDIVFESREGAGSEFILTVRLARIGDERSVADPVDAPPAAFQAERPLRVLAAEDNSVNQMVLRTLLQQAGIEPVIVEDGAAAVSAWNDEDWDVILMDVQMPIMDGPTATRTIRMAEVEANRARTPIIALTANAMSHQVSEYLAAGMDAFIAKPIRVEDLFATLQAVLDKAEEAKAA